jgi:hypothetical protein
MCHRAHGVKATWGKKFDERWKVIMATQDIKIELEKEWIEVKKRKKDFVLLTVDTSTMDAETKEWNFGERRPSCNGEGQERRCKCPTTPTPTTTPTST